MKIIPKILKYGDRAVDLAKFTIKVGKTKLKNKKTGWYIVYNYWLIFCVNSIE